MKTINRYFVLFLISALVGLSTTVAASASEWVARMHASACYTQGGAPIDSEFGIQNNSTSVLTLLCPAHNQTGQLQSTTTSLILTVYDDSTVGAVVAAACGSFAIARGGQCNPTVSTGVATKGIAGLTVPTAGVWIDDLFVATYGYVLVRLPAKDGTFRSSLQGLQQAGN